MTQPQDATAQASKDPTIAFSGPSGVFASECASIAQRRANQGITDNTTYSQLAADIDIPHEQWSQPLTELFQRLNDEQQTKLWQEHATAHPERGGMANLTGLALSGGGIRSATFNLGLLQVLSWTRIFKYVDYLSTVSGGGYIGACVSSMFASPLKSFPCEHRQGQPEGPIFRHLRNNAEYLAPGGAVDVLRIPMTVLRGMMVNLVVILPYLLIAALITAMIHPTADALNAHWLNTHTDWIPDWFGSSFIVSKALLLIIGLSFLLFPIAYLLVHRFAFRAISNWKLRNRVGAASGLLLLLTAVAALIELQPVAIGKLMAMRESSGWNISALSGALTAVQASIPAAISIWLMKNAERLLAKHVLALIGLSALFVFWIIYLWISVLLIDGRYVADGQWLWPVVILAALLLYAIVFVDMNLISVHAFYRDRLSKAYIVKQGVDQQGRACIEQNDKQLLSQLNTAYAPYHIINAALNLKNTAEQYRRARQADSFVFSRHFIGSDITGYCRTENMEAVSAHVNLGTAMAISGAAASPNMGKQTNRLFAFFMSMMNIRLNYWLPNPKHAASRAHAKIPRNPMQRVGPLYLLRELFGWLSKKSICINVSDGGHFENLALYELMRRECRFIICGDGEADPSLRFNGLAEALRMAQIDFGVIVKMEGLDAIRAGEQNFAIGRIRYSGGRIGWLLYFKQSLRGDDSLLAALDSTRFATSKRRTDCSRYDDNAYIAEYKSRMADFPHQSTGDQFFDEAQFECTRAVGYDVAYKTLCKY